MNDSFAHRALDWDQPSKIKMTQTFVQEVHKIVNVKKNWKALEIGAGTGLVGMQLLPSVRSVVFEDVSGAMLDVLKQKLTGNENVEIVQGELMDYKKQDIDFAFSCMAFHHVADIHQLLRHLYDICKTNATVVVADLVTEDGSFHSFEPIPHKGFDMEWISQKFSDAGFLVKHKAVYNTLTRERSPGILFDYEQFILVAVKQ